MDDTIYPKGVVEMLNKRKIYIATAVVCFGAFLGFILPPWDTGIAYILVIGGGSVAWLEFLRLGRVAGKRLEKELGMEEHEEIPHQPKFWIAVILAILGGIIVFSAPPGYEIIGVIPACIALLLLMSMAKQALKTLAEQILKKW